MFLRNCWYVAAESREVGREPLGRIMLGEPIVLYRKADGTPVALEDRCCHRRVPLHKGKVIGDDLQCGYHGFLYDASGACIRVPGQEHAPPGGIGVRAYPAVERHGYVWAWMGEREKADPSEIVDFHHNADPAWAAVGALLPVAANYLLLVENLIDLSHVAFVHAATIGSDDSNATLKHERGEGYVRVTRAAADIPAPPHMRRMGCAERANMTKIITFTPPSNIAIEVIWDELQGWNGQKPRSLRSMVINAITPETERSSNYFWAHARNFEIANAQMTELFAREVPRAFNEDKDILEAQQRCIELDPAAPTINVHGDWGGVQAQRLVAQLIAAEQNRAVAAQ